MKKINFFTFCLAIIMGTLSNISSANDKKVGIFYDERFLLHDTGPNHPENPERLIPVIRNLKNNDQIMSNKVRCTKLDYNNDILRQALRLMFA